MYNYFYFLCVFCKFGRKNCIFKISIFKEKRSIFMGEYFLIRILIIVFYIEKNLIVLYYC